MNNQTQFVAFTDTVVFSYNELGTDINYVNTIDVEIDNKVIDMSNISITKANTQSNTVTFTFSGAYGEEISDNDVYEVRENNEFKTYTQFSKLPDFSVANTYLVNFAPDNRHDVILTHRFATPAGTVYTTTQQIMLDQNRHLARLISIGETIEQRVAAEKIQKSRMIRNVLGLYEET